MRSFYLLLFSSVALPLMAQNHIFSFGVKGGIPAETPLGQTHDMPFAVGPTVNIRILPYLSLETGVMFHRLGENANNSAYVYPADSLTLVYNSRRAHAVEVPILAKYYVFGERHTWRPFVTIGPTIRHTSLKTSYASSILSGTSFTTLAQPFPNFERSKSKVDPVAGVGVDFKAGRIHIDPEARYSYWRAGEDLYPVRKNQVEILVGFRF
jgi:hypothetical protein